MKKYLALALCLFLFPLTGWAGKIDNPGAAGGGGTINSGTINVLQMNTDGATTIGDSDPVVTTDGNSVILTAGTYTSTTGFDRPIRSSSTFAPTSGSAAFAVWEMEPTINQTGGASGATRGLFINPSLTAATDWRAIEASGGSGGVAAFFTGNVGIGSTIFGTDANSVLLLNIGTPPTTSPANTVQLYAHNSSDAPADATFGLRTEQVAESTATFTQSHRLKIFVNGTEYWLSLDDTGL